MKYYLDFEASQYNRKIISIGCTSENGRTFYSLVRPSSKKVMTKLIERLTGLTWDLLQNAPIADEVFVKFYEWLNEDHDAEKIFYVYGCEDKNFIINSAKSMNNQIAISCTDFILNSLIDYTSVVKQKFHADLALITVLAYYRGQPITSQRHNALEDAQWLMEIATNIEKDPKEYPITFSNELKKMYPKPRVEKEKIDAVNRVLECRYHRDNNEGNPTRVFNNENEAVEFLYKLISTKGGQAAKKENILKRLHSAINQGKKYCEYSWKWSK